jgi:predicted lipid-binding transport protein (Tim44 family)
MKKFISLLSLILVLATTSMHAEAKRFGARSYGKTYKTAPAKSQPKMQQGNQQKQGSSQSTKRQSSSKKGMLGGMLGGLLMGGLLASMIDGDDFEGIQFMDIAIIAILAFMIMKIIKMVLGTKKRTEPIYLSNGAYNRADLTRDEYFAPGDRDMASPELNDVPMAFYPGFDQQHFTNTARDYYRKVQDAWHTKNLTPVRDIMESTLYKRMVIEMAHDDMASAFQLDDLDCFVVRSEFNDKLAQISLRFTGLYTDLDTGKRDVIVDTWHLLRELTDSEKSWKLVGVEANKETVC